MFGPTARQIKDKLESLTGDNRLSIDAVAGSDLNSNTNFGLWTYTGGSIVDGHFYVGEGIAISMVNKDGVNWSSYFETLDGKHVRVNIKSITSSTFILFTGDVHLQEGYIDFTVNFILSSEGEFTGSEVAAIDITTDPATDGEISGSINIDSLSLPNGSGIKVGALDNELGGAGGISLLCSVGYELNWQAGHLTTTDVNANPAPLIVDSFLQFQGTSHNSTWGQYQAIFQSSDTETSIQLANTGIGGRTYSIFSTGGSSGVGQGKFQIGDVTGGYGVLTIDNAGNIGINQANPEHKLEVIGDIYGASILAQAQTLAGNVFEVHNPSNFSDIHAYIDYLGNGYFPSVNTLNGYGTFDSPAPGAARLIAGDTVWLQSEDSLSGDRIVSFVASGGGEVAWVNQAGGFGIGAFSSITSTNREGLVILTDAGSSFDGNAALNIPQPDSVSSIFRALKIGSNFYLDNDQSGYSQLNINGGSNGIALNIQDGNFIFTGSLIQLGGTSASSPALKADGTSIDVRLADDSDYASLTAGTVTAAFFVGDGSQLTNLPSTPSTAAYILVQNQQASGSNGGAVSAGSWTASALNTIAADTTSSASINTSTITLPAGTYRAKWSAPFYKSGASQTRLYDTSNSAVLGTGMSVLTDTSSTAGVDGTCVSNGFTRFTLSGSTNIQLQYYTAGTGGGQAGQGNPANTGTTEIYATLELVRE